MNRAWPFLKEALSVALDWALALMAVCYFWIAWQTPPPPKLQKPLPVEGEPQAVLPGERTAQTNSPASQAGEAGAAPAQSLTLQSRLPAAENGDAAAQLFVGIAYQTGNGVAVDFAEAAKWYRRAAEQGNPGAALLLGVLYTKGLGVKTDTREAFKWFREAAEKGAAEAQYNLGLGYQVGNELPRDNVEACKWYSLAARQGHKQAAHNRELLAAKMTPEQVADATRQAREFELKGAISATNSPVR